MSVLSASNLITTFPPLIFTSFSSFSIARVKASIRLLISSKVYDLISGIHNSSPQGTNLHPTLFIG